MLARSCNSLKSNNLIGEVLTPATSVAKRSDPVDFLAATIASTDSRYPKRLREVSDSPDRLDLRGRLPDPELAIAIVGARAADADEQQLAYELARALTRRGALVVSGGALGVDAAAHRGALAAAAEPGAPDTGTTVAVLGCGIDVVYPQRNAALYRELAERGALVSQFRSDAPPRSWHFARRNRTLAAMADAVVVVGAGAHSGALRTARAARDYGRLVAAVPGRPGCEALIASGAAVVRDVDDLDRALAGAPVRPAVELPEASTPHFALLQRLEEDGCRDVEGLVSGTGLSLRVVQRALTTLELDGLIVPRPGLEYECSQLARELFTARGARG